MSPTDKSFDLRHINLGELMTIADLKIDSEISMIWLHIPFNNVIHSFILSEVVQRASACNCYLFLALLILVMFTLFVALQKPGLAEFGFGIVSKRNNTFLILFETIETTCCFTANTNEDGAFLISLAKQHKSLVSLTSKRREHSPV